MLVFIDEDYGYQLWLWEPELTSEDPHQELKALWEKHKPDVSCENRLENLPGKLEKIYSTSEPIDRQLYPGEDFPTPRDLGVDYFAVWGSSDDSRIYRIVKDRWHDNE